MRYAVLIAVLSFAVTGAVCAANPPLTASEKAFVAKTSASLNSAPPPRPRKPRVLRCSSIRGDAPAPKLSAFPVLAARWVKIPEHVHYAYTVDGNLKYGVAHATPALRTGTITATELRVNGARLPKDAKLKWAMYHPAVWDLAMWTVPNPKGAFADKNRNVK